MNLLMIHNEYAAPSGEDIQFQAIARLLSEHGHSVRICTRSSAEISATLPDKAWAFFTGIYNPFSRRAVRNILIEEMPDLVFVQNLFPLISPSILPIFQEQGIPVVMRVANYRLMCPNGLHLNRGGICERCLNGREYWCFLLNCENNVFKSAGYALRSAAARWFKWYEQNVSLYICASHFLRNRMISAGYDPQKIVIIPNVVPEMPGADTPSSESDSVVYAGRISREKGITILLDAAEQLPHIRFKIAGKTSSAFSLPDRLPKNVEYFGFLERNGLASFYQKARIAVSPSVCFETFGISIAEAMLHKKPVIASRLGVLPEFIDDGITGLLAEPGNSEDLARKIRHLWESPNLCEEMGRLAREKVLREYSPDTYYSRILGVLEAAISTGRQNRVATLGSPEAVQ